MFEVTVLVLIHSDDVSLLMESYLCLETLALEWCDNLLKGNPCIPQCKCP